MNLDQCYSCHLERGDGQIVFLQRWFQKYLLARRLKLFQFADDNFKFDENGRNFSKRIENIVGL